MKKLVCKTTAALLLATLVMASFSACTGGETQTDINLDIDLTQKPTLSVLMPNSGYDDTYINEDPNAQVVEDVMWSIRSCPRPMRPLRSICSSSTVSPTTP